MLGLCILGDAYFGGSSRYRGTIFSIGNRNSVLSFSFAMNLRSNHCLKMAILSPPASLFSLVINLPADLISI